MFTNKTIVTPVRGAGRQHGVFVSERLLDIAAKELGIDRVEIRKRNLLGPDRFPHNHEIMFQDSAPLVYDSGNYLPTLEQAAERIGYESFVREEQSRLRAEGQARRHRHRLLRRGHGDRAVRGRAGDGRAERHSCMSRPASARRGRDTSRCSRSSWPKCSACAVENVRVVTGDTREFHWGTGTFASRGAVVAGSACHAAAMSVRDKILDLAASVLKVAKDELELAGGRVVVRGRATAASISATSRARRIRCAARCGRAPSRASRARRTSVPIAAAPPAACTR